MDVKEESLLGKAIGDHWYYQAKASALTRMLDQLSPKVILDVGAGSGFFSRHLLKTTRASRAYCIDPHYAGDRDLLIDGKPIHFRQRLVRSEADLILLMDVLEHVDDDLALLIEYLEKTPPGCQVLLSVPAFQCLWSAHDVFLEHRRRYSLLDIERVTEKAGLKIHKSCYFYALVFPIAWVTRLIQRHSSISETPRSQLKQHHPLTNALLLGLCRLETPWMPINRLFGLTAFVLAEKVSS